MLVPTDNIYILAKGVMGNILGNGFSGFLQLQTIYTLGKGELVHTDYILGNAFSGLLQTTYIRQ